MDKPKLTELGIKSFLNHSLRKCNDFKTFYFNGILNLSLLLLLCIIIATILIIKYKGKLSDEEKEIKDKENKNYILSKIKNYQISKLKEQQNLITGLSHF